MSQPRPIFFLSDGTGITAETLGNTLLTQFEGVTFHKTTLPFINTVERAKATVDYIDHLAKKNKIRPILISTTVSDAVRDVLRKADAVFMDLFDQFIPLLEDELAQKSTHAQGRAHGVSDIKRYNARIAAMNYAMEHDDGQSTRDMGQAELILIAPSRCGKTPTSLYLALQHGVFATNYPLITEDLEASRLPAHLMAHRDKLFGLSSDPERLAQVRSERRPGSQYASLTQCAFELRQAEQLYRRHGIPFVNSANMSIEEMATVIMQEKGLRKPSF
jgi:regulator of PEP synthase PpsR (kinase-PPPase family)